MRFEMASNQSANIGLLLTIVLIVILGCAKSNRESINTSPTPAPRKLSAEVSLLPSGVLLKNTDSTDWPAVTVKLNLKEIGSNDGVADLGSLEKGKSITIPYGDFTVGTARFNLAKTKILTVYIKSGDGSSKLFLCPGTRCQPS